MVIWPELSATAIARGGRTAPLIDLAAQPGIAPFVTSYPDAARPMPHNTASVFSGSGESARYFKRHPFAEEVNIHAPGEDPVTVEVGGVVYGLAICFDSCFPASMRSTATHPGPAGTRPQIILLPNLDPPDHTGFIQGIHAAFTPFRAAETGLPIVRADITARSMIVEARGDILAEAGEGTAEIIRADLPLGGAGAPLAMAAGDRVFYLCAVIVLMAAIRGGLRPRRSPG